MTVNKYINRTEIEQNGMVQSGDTNIYRHTNHVTR